MTTHRARTTHPTMLLVGITSYYYYIIETYHFIDTYKIHYTNKTRITA